MNVKNLLFLLASIILIVVNYFIFNEIIAPEQNDVQQTFVEVKESTNIASSKSTTKTEKQTDKIKQEIIKEQTYKPLLAIVIDDISFPWHLRLINTVNLPLNMSFLPPTSRHPESHLLASDYDKYMVHLPLEAKNYYASEIGTLKIDSTYDFIDKKIKLIRSLFPKAKYINNHTGSKFTSNLDAMQKLSLALSKYNFIFLDSKTIASSKAKVVFDYDVLSRDTFLDNNDNIPYIKRQIKRAVQHAINKGYSISIGHPKENTLKAIKQMEKYITKYTKVVYIDELHNAISNK